MNDQVERSSDRPQKTVRAASSFAELEPILVPLHVGERLTGCSRTSFWRLRKLGLVETVRIGSRDLVVYDSLKRLAQNQAA